jgi:hypothetical protein
MESIVHGSKTIDQKIIKLSRRRLVVSGDSYELYTYAQPYTYNWPALPRTFGGVIEDKVIIEADESRRESNLRSCRQRIRRLVNSNVNQYGQRTKFVTLTFADNVTSIRQANTEFKNFTKRLNYKFSVRSKYLSVVEFQKRGAIHYHVLYFNLPYIKNAGFSIQSVWDNGNVDVKALKNVRNVGSYVTKYLQKDVFDNRLVGEKAFFCSKNLLQPVELKDEKRIDFFLSSCTIKPNVTKSFRSGFFGDVNYQSGNIKQIKSII